MQYYYKIQKYLMISILPQCSLVEVVLVEVVLVEVVLIKVVLVKVVLVKVVLVKLVEHLSSLQRGQMVVGAKIIHAPHST